MYKFYTLNKNNICQFKNLNNSRVNFNVLNKDFFEVYYNSNHFEKILLKKQLKLLVQDSRYIGYLWTENKTNSVCVINSMFVIEDVNILKCYRQLLSSIKSNSVITYNCEKNELNYDFLKKLGFYKSKGLLEMSINLDSILPFAPSDHIQFHKVVKGRDEDLRCTIQNSIFSSEDRVPLKVEDIYYDEIQDYYYEDGAILMKINNSYVGYGQIIIKNECPFIVNFGILENYRNKGYGKILLKNLLNILYKKGKKLVKIKVDCNNKSAIKLYKNIGFISDKEQSQWQLKKRE